MKKYKSLFLLLISLISINLFAQKNEIKVMYSPLSLQRMDGWGKDLDGLDAKYMGTFMIDYNRYVKPRLKVGINVAYDHEKVTGTKTETIRNPHPPFDLITTTYKQSNKEGWLFFGPQVGYEYIQKDNFRMGSLVGVSMVLINRDDEVKDAFTSKETEVNFFFHAEVVNFTWGKTHGLTGQLGYGHKGLVSVGYFVRW